MNPRSEVLANFNDAAGKTIIPIDVGWLSSGGVDYQERHYSYIHGISGGARNGNARVFMFTGDTRKGISAIMRGYFAEQGKLEKEILNLAATQDGCVGLESRHPNEPHDDVVSVQWKYRHNRPLIIDGVSLLEEGSMETLSRLVMPKSRGDRQCPLDGKDGIARLMVTEEEDSNNINISRCADVHTPILTVPAIATPDDLIKLFARQFHAAVDKRLGR